MSPMLITRCIYPKHGKSDFFPIYFAKLTSDILQGFRVILSTLRCYTHVVAICMMLASSFFKCFSVAMLRINIQTLIRPYNTVRHTLAMYPSVSKCLDSGFTPASTTPELLQKAMDMLLLGKKSHLSCSMLLAELAEAPNRPSLRTSIPIPGYICDSSKCSCLLTII
jgi:hypothetical protein